MVTLKQRLNAERDKIALALKRVRGDMERRRILLDAEEREEARLAMELIKLDDFLKELDE